VSRKNASRAQAVLGQLARPIYGYAGPIDERVDFEIVRRIAEGEGNVVLVGPIERIDPVVLPRRPNLHFTGALEESEAAAFSAGFDVAIEPFVRDEAADEGAEAEPS
jgi:hypothetical protein